MKIKYGTLEHLQTLTARAEQDILLNGYVTGQLFSADEKSLVLQLFYGYVKTRG